MSTRGTTRYFSVELQMSLRIQSKSVLYFWWKMRVSVLSVGSMFPTELYILVLIMTNHSVQCDVEAAVA